MKFINRVIASGSVVLGKL